MSNLDLLYAKKNKIGELQSLYNNSIISAEFQYDIDKFINKKGGVSKLLELEYLLDVFEDIGATEIPIRDDEKDIRINLSKSQIQTLCKNMKIFGVKNKLKLNNLIEDIERSTTTDEIVNINW